MSTPLPKTMLVPFGGIEWFDYEFIDLNLLSTPPSDVEKAQPEQATTQNEAKPK
jgi:hypothetical protein